MAASIRRALVEAYSVSRGGDHADAIEYMVSALEAYIEEQDGLSIEEDYVESLVEPFLLDMGKKEDDIKLRTPRFIQLLESNEEAEASQGDSRSSHGSRHRVAALVAPLQSGKAAFIAKRSDSIEIPPGSDRQLSDVGRQILGRALSHGSSSGDHEAASAPTLAGLVGILDDPAARGIAQEGAARRGKRRRRRKPKAAASGEGAAPGAPERAGPESGDAGGAPGGLTAEGQSRIEAKTRRRKDPHRRGGAEGAGVPASGAGDGSGGRGEGGGGGGGGHRSSGRKRPADGEDVVLVGRTSVARVRSTGAKGTATDKTAGTDTPPMLLREDSAMSAQASTTKAMQYILRDDNVLATAGAELAEAKKRFPGCKLRVASEPGTGMELHVRALVRTDKGGFMVRLPLQHFGDMEFRPMPTVTVVEGKTMMKAKAAAFEAGGSLAGLDALQWISHAQLADLARTLNFQATDTMSEEAQRAADEGHMHGPLPGWMGRLVEALLRTCLQKAAQAAAHHVGQGRGGAVAAAGAGSLNPPAVRREETLLVDTAGKGITKRRRQEQKEQEEMNTVKLKGEGMSYQLPKGSIPAPALLEQGVNALGINKDIVPTGVISSHLPSGYRNPASFVLLGRLYVHGSPFRKQVLSIAPGSATHQWIPLQTTGTLVSPPNLQYHQAHVTAKGEAFLFADGRSPQRGYYKIRVVADRVVMKTGTAVRRDACYISSVVVAPQGDHRDHLYLRYGSVSVRLPGGRRILVLGGADLPNTKRKLYSRTDPASIPLESIKHALGPNDMVGLLRLSPKGNTSEIVFTSGAVPELLLDHSAVTCGNRVVVVGGAPLANSSGNYGVKVLDVRHMVWYDVKLPNAALKVRARVRPMLARLPGAVGVILFGGSMANGEPLGGLYSLLVDMQTADRDLTPLLGDIETRRTEVEGRLEEAYRQMRGTQILEMGPDRALQEEEIRHRIGLCEDELRLLEGRFTEDVLRDLHSAAKYDAYVCGRWELLHSKVKNPNAGKQRHPRRSVDPSGVEGAAEREEGTSHFYDVPQHLDYNPVASDGTMQRLGSSLIVFGGQWADGERRIVKPNTKAFLIDSSQKQVRIAASQLNMDIARLWEEQLLVDVIISCRGGEKVPAHRSILHLFVPYFRRVFQEFHAISLEGDSDSDSDSEGSGAGEEEEDEEEAFRRALLADLEDHVGGDVGYSVAAVTAGGGGGGGGSAEAAAAEGSGAAGTSGGAEGGVGGFMTESDAKDAAMAALRRAASTGGGAEGGDAAGRAAAAQLLLPPLDPPDGVMEIEEDMDGGLLRLILGYIYTGGIDVPPEKVPAVLELACRLGLEVSEREAAAEAKRKAEQKETIRDLAAAGKRGGDKKSKKKKKSKSDKPDKGTGAPPPLEWTKVLEGGVETHCIGRLVNLCRTSRGGGVSVIRNPTIGSSSAELRAHLRTGVLRNDLAVAAEKAEAKAAARVAGEPSAGLIGGAAAGGGGRVRDDGGDEEDEGLASQSAEALAVASVSSFVSSELAHLAGCDVLVVAGDESVMIPAHRAILAARSPYFRSLFDAGMAESRAVRVPVGMEDAGREVTEALVRYIYTDSASGLEPDDAPALLTLANLHVLPRLASMCERLMLRSFDMTDPESVLGIYGFASYQGQAGNRLMAMCEASLLQLDSSDVEEAARHLRGELEEGTLRQLQRRLRAGARREFADVDLLGPASEDDDEGERDAAGGGGGEAGEIRVVAASGAGAD